MWGKRNRIVQNANVTPDSEASRDEIVDLETLRALQAEFEGTDVFQELVGVFVARTPERLASLRGAMEKADAPAVAAEAHAVKGSAVSMGAGAMGKLAERIEELGRSEELAEGEALVAALEQSFARTCEVLEREASSPAG